MFQVYVLQSLTSGEYYIGHTDNLTRRLKEHNDGASHYTRHHRPWKLVWSEEFGSRGEAMVREREIKSRKSRLFLEKLVGGGGLGERPVTKDL